MATNNYVQMPPDSTGKKMYALQHTIGGVPTLVSAVHAADPENPEYIQHVDYRGAASVRFSEGSPLSDAFGNLKTSSVMNVGSYDFVQESNDDLYSDYISGSGSITYLSDASTMALVVGTDSGASASRTTNKYHYYLPGVANLSLLTITLTDSYMDGCQRSWGIFDKDDGAFFRLSDVGVLQCVIRDKTSGTIEERATPRSDWNGDKCDGTGLSKFNLDVTKLNIYWIDYQWLGAGRVRFGVVDSYGNRIVCHTMLNAGQRNYPYMRTGSLPLRAEIKNNKLTNGSAGIRLTCAAVHTEGSISYTYWRYQHEFLNKAITTNNVYCIALKSKPTVDGAHNRTNAYPEFLDLYITGGEIKLDVIWDRITTSGSTWSLDNGSTVLADTAGLYTPNGNEYKPKSYYLSSGTHELDISKYFEKNDIGLVARADELEPEYILILASKLSGNPVVTGSIGYAELR